MNKILKTYTGIRIDEVPLALAKPFDDPKAYRPMTGAIHLTDINTGFMLERVTQVFGMKGVGWNLQFSPENMEIVLKEDDPWVTARLRYAELVIHLLDEQGEIVSIHIPTSGTSTNEPGYAEEGARTSALGCALKGLCFQLGVYKGELDHNNASSSRKFSPPPIEVPVKPPAPAVVPKTGDLPLRKDQVPLFAALDSAGEYVVTVGTKHNGKKLSELSNQALVWYASLDGKGMSPGSPKARELQEQACRFLAEKKSFPG